MIKITFITRCGDSIDVTADAGTTVMEVAVSAGIDGIAAECGGGCSCATCHVILDNEWYTKTGEPNELESSMLELADEVSERSRLSCQVEVTKELDGMVVHVVDG